MDGFGSIVRFAYRSVRASMATTLTVALMLALVALLASWLPARRAAAVPPTMAMRQE